ncbi:DUF2066 domain-containing protein [Pseudohongiella spirulinae]|uniref:DUF2066 domain-containing protein n=1 Tax=Pseudohongiella spirulinae TaxID=1249552 RepID=A0A0S2KE98_9GAMM|nr:DUF2066 domain-containing protein [Pseudohongiella spirulinae]ALO46637.1 hypothetical protein PS2015_1996 [Pseudohongiella spirulinae]
MSDLTYKPQKWLSMQVPLAILRSLGALILILMSLAAQALPVQGLYESEIAVSNQSEAERNRAYRQALEQVVVKVTGERRWLDNARIAQALSTAGSYVAEVSYRAENMQGWIHVRFDQRQLDALLNQENIPVWDNNRASVLMLLTIQAADGRRQMLSSSSEHDYLEQAKQFADRRAVPVLFPLLDLTDRRLVSSQQAWDLSNEALSALAERYAADSILAARILETADGQQVGLWKFLFRDSETVFDHIAMSSEAYMEMPLDRVTNRLAQHFGLVLSEFDRREQVTVRVDGVGTLSDHRQLVSYLESLTVVRSARVAALHGDSVELRLDLAGNQQILAEFISLGRDLQTVSAANDARQTADLHYRWTR